ncbi:hypothetical protein PF005_g6621 [Phytophthora fragariae]|nr:hypothetical protein PF003_g37650 [Phytophthora fragariae]KAE8943543.1 hypothetical protein PF009_g6734 [Phytophthora fragariae]KAE9120521.1 hypothetical protein PF007_g8128 [Phytophthora fragariae]KAE9147768.1 hypothetical protein PF006_g7582 [Phytophthora fragariae]KAE9222619.1 hypothetical protein PF005_g6621 [Phytophthora fragariae]
MADEKGSDESKDATSTPRTMKAPPKMAPPPNANADAKGGPSADPTKKKKALPPPSNPPPKAGGSAAAAFRSKSSLPPPNGPPPGAGAPSASVAKIRGAARPPSGAPPGAAQAKAGPPPNGQAKAMGPPSSTPPTTAAPSMGPPSSAPSTKPHPTGAPPSTAPPKAAAKPPITPRTGDGESKGDAKAATGPPKPRPDAKRTPPTSARGPPGDAKPAPRAAPVDILGDDSPTMASNAGAPVKTNAVPAGKPPKPVSQTQRPPATAPAKAPPADKPPVVKPPLVMKSTMEVLNDANAALSARSRGSEDEDESSRRLSTPSTKEKEKPGVFTTKMGMAAQFSTQLRLNVPEEEVIVVKKREAKSTEAEAKPDVSANAKSSRPIANIDDSFEDVEEIPFLEDGKADVKPKDGREEKAVEHEDDPEIVMESKHGPAKPSASRSSSSSQGDTRSEHKDNNHNLNEEKEDGESVLRRNATHEDIYDELWKMKRGSQSPREAENTGSDHERDHERDHDRDHDRDRERNDSRSSSFNDKKDKGSTNSDENTNEHSGREGRESRDRDRDRDRERSREKRKDRRRSKQDEPKKIQAQFFNPKSVPYIPDHLLDFVKRPLECGRGQIVKCFIERNDSGPNKLAPIYTLLLEVNSSSGRPIMYARKKATSRITSHYVISLNRDDLFLSRMMRSHQYIGKLRSSTSMMEYCLYDQGDNPEDLDSDCEVDDELRQSIRAELAVIRYHNSKKPYPRKMEVVIPAILENGQGYLEWRPLSRDQMMEEHVRNITAAGGQNVMDASNFAFLHKRETKYDPLSSCIVDFRSRATCVSVKNFQLVHSEPTNEQMRDQYRKAYPDFVYEDQGTVSLPQEYVLLQLGKVGKDCFNMDFQYPLSMLQAFAISLSRFDTKQR